MSVLPGPISAQERTEFESKLIQVITRRLAREDIDPTMVLIYSGYLEDLNARPEMRRSGQWYCKRCGSYDRRPSDIVCSDCGQIWPGSEYEKEEVQKPVIGDGREIKGSQPSWVYLEEVQRAKKGKN